MENIALMIKKKAIELGYEKCGIIPISDVSDYTEKLEERISRIKMGEGQYGKYRRFADPSAEYEWAKSIVVLVHAYSVYNMPNELNGLYGKAYLFDGRIDKASPVYKIRYSFGQYLNELGVQAITEEKFGVTAMRWAAFKAGLGLIRKNNFFYTENGSYVRIEAWLIDAALELKETCEVKKCPSECKLCIKACPTKTLCDPYTMTMADCVSFLSTFAGIPSSEATGEIGGWLYGCDACQDVCPNNKNKWTGGTDFPGLSELKTKLLPEMIMAMPYSEIENFLAPKFWYIGTDKLWKWKIDALTVMGNNFKMDYREPIISGLTDASDVVRDFARRTCDMVGIEYRKE